MTLPLLHSLRLHSGQLRTIGSGSAVALNKAHNILNELVPMTVAPPEIIHVDTRRVSCDGASDIRSGGQYRPAALGHPLIYLEIDESGYVDCGYCDRRFVLKGGPADTTS